MLGLLFIYGIIFEATGGNIEEEGPGFLTALLAVGFFGTVIGVIVLGAAMIRANVLTRWAAGLFTIGLPLGLIIDMATGAFFEENGDTPEVGFFVGPPLFCIGLIWLGFEMWKGRGTATEPARSAGRRTLSSGRISRPRSLLESRPPHSRRCRMTTRGPGRSWQPGEA